MRTAGWEVRNHTDGGYDHFVVVGAPHTTNWDFAVTLGVGAHLDMTFGWVGKQALFRPPMGAVMRRLGGVPVERGARRNYVEQLADHLLATDQMGLVVAPEGTRSKGQFWKSGFLYIAREADVPIVLGFADYDAREAGLGPTLDPHEPTERIMDRIRSFYRPEMALYPEKFTRPRLRGEDDV